jgi:hypothetical protein
VRLRAVAGIAVAAALAAGLAGCASEPVAFRDSRTTVHNASAQVEPGRSTKADVAAALGPGQAIVFDSGWEVWVWRQKEAGFRQRSEFVALFDAAGVVRKVRVRRPSE